MMAMTAAAATRHRPRRREAGTAAARRAEVRQREVLAVAALLDAIRQQGVARTERLPTLQRLRRFRQQQRRARAPAAPAGLAEALLAASEYLCDWRLRAALLADARQDGLLGERQYAEQLAGCHFRLGELQAALDCLWPQLLQAPHDAALLQQQRQLLQRAADPCCALRCDSAPELSLLPLEPHHLAGFRWQFDARIAELCNLPDFGSDAQWEAWLARNRANAQRHLFALQHHEWGFIGSVCLEVHAGSGFFYYWLGADFQGFGLGPCAVTTLLDFGARELGMQRCYAKVYWHNEASLRAVRKAGFEPLPFAAQAPNDDEVFFHCGPPQSRSAHLQQLSQLLQDLDAGITLAEILALPPLD